MKAKGKGKGIVLLSSLIIGIILLSAGQAEAALPTLGPGDFVIQTYYYENGFLLSVVDNYGNQTFYEYGLRTKQEDADGYILLTFQYDGSGNLKSLTDQNGTVTKYEGGRTTEVGYWKDAMGKRIMPGQGGTFIATAEYEYGDDGILDHVRNYRAEESGTKTLYSKTLYEDGKAQQEVLQINDSVLGLAQDTVLRVWHYEAGSLQYVETTTGIDGMGALMKQTTHFEGGKESFVINDKGTTILQYVYDEEGRLNSIQNLGRGGEVTQTTWFNSKGQRTDVRAGASLNGALVSIDRYDGAVLDYREYYAWDGTTIKQIEEYEYNQQVALRSSDGWLLMSYEYINGFLVSTTDHTKDTKTTYKYGLRTNESYTDSSAVLATFSYDISGNLSSITNYRDSSTTFYQGGRALGVQNADGVTTAEYVDGDKDGINDYILNKQQRTNDNNTPEDPDDDFQEPVDYSITYLRADGQQEYEVLSVTDSDLGLVAGQPKTGWNYGANGELKSIDSYTKENGGEYQTTHFNRKGREDYVTNSAGTTITTYVYVGAKLNYTFDTTTDEAVWYNNKAQRVLVVMALDDEGNPIDPTTLPGWETMSLLDLADEGVSVQSKFVYNGATLDSRKDYEWNDTGTGWYNIQTEFYENNQPIQLRGHSYDKEHSGGDPDGWWTITVNQEWLNTYDSSGELAAMGIKVGDSITYNIDESVLTEVIEHITVVDEDLDTEGIQNSDLNDLVAYLNSIEAFEGDTAKFIADYRIVVDDAIDVVIYIEDSVAELDRIDRNGTPILDLGLLTVPAGDVPLTIDPALFGVEAVKFVYDNDGNLLEVLDALTGELLLKVNYTDDTNTTLASVEDRANQLKTYYHTAEGDLQGKADRVVMLDENGDVLTMTYRDAPVGAETDPYADGQVHWDFAPGKTGEVLLVDYTYNDDGTTNVTYWTWSSTTHNGDGNGSFRYSYRQDTLDTNGRLSERVYYNDPVPLGSCPEVEGTVVKGADGNYYLYVAEGTYSEDDVTTDVNEMTLNGQYLLLASVDKSADPADPATRWGGETDYGFFDQLDALAASGQTITITGDMAAGAKNSNGESVWTEGGGIEDLAQQYDQRNHSSMQYYAGQEVIIFYLNSDFDFGY